MIWITDVKGHVTYLNETYLDFTGLPLAATLGDGWMKVPHPDDVERCRDVYVKASEQRQPFQLEQRMRRHDGEYRWVVSAGVPRYNDDHSVSGYIGTAVDITERRLAEDNLSTLSQRLIQAQELERARVARELHDDIGQRLAVLLLRLETAKQRVEVPMPELGQEIENVVQTAMAIMGDVQSLSHRLHSSQLKHVGLKAAARAVCAELTERTTVEVQFHSESRWPVCPRTCPCAYIACCRKHCKTPSNTAGHGTLTCGSATMSAVLN